MTKLRVIAGLVLTGLIILWIAFIPPESRYEALDQQLIHEVNLSLKQINPSWFEDERNFQEHMIGVFNLPSDFARHKSFESRITRSSEDNITLTLSRRGLRDDSTEGIRYRVEYQFDSNMNSWQIKWAGTSVKCQPKRGPSFRWHKGPCS